MSRKSLIHARQELLSQGQDFVKSNADTKTIYRATCVNFVLSGLSIDCVSQHSGEHRNTISRWVRTVDEKGFAALRAARQDGRPSKLTAQQKSVVKQAVQEDPERHGYSVWQGTTVVDFIRKKFHVEYGVRAAQKLLKNLEFSLVRPQMFPNKQADNQKEREKFKKNSTTSK